MQTWSSPYSGCLSVSTPLWKEETEVSSTKQSPVRNYCSREKMRISVRIRVQSSVQVLLLLLTSLHLLLGPALGFTEFASVTLGIVLWGRSVKTCLGECVVVWLLTALPAENAGVSDGLTMAVPRDWLYRTVCPRFIRLAAEPRSHNLRHQEWWHGHGLEGLVEGEPPVKDNPGPRCPPESNLNSQEIYQPLQGWNLMSITARLAPGRWLPLLCPSSGTKHNWELEKMLLVFSTVTFPQNNLTLPC